MPEVIGTVRAFRQDDFGVGDYVVRDAAQQMANAIQSGAFLVDDGASGMLVRSSMTSLALGVELPAAP